MQFKDDIIKKIKAALTEQDTDKFTDGLNELTEKAAEEVLNKALAEYADAQDREILQARGARLLTSAETTYYNKLITALKSDNPKAAITGIEERFPETVIDETFTDLETNHDVIKHLDVRTVNAKVKVYFSSQDEGNKAVWGKITGKITKEVGGSFSEIDAGKLKLSCFISIPNAMLDLGPTYIDRFVRTILYESLANGIEDATINNLVAENGPIGMIADLGKGATVSGSGDSKTTTYTEKTPVALTEWTAKGLAGVMATLAKTRNGNPRRVDKIFLLVNPVDYYSIVMPAMTVKNALGEFVVRSPYPVDIVQSPYVPSSKAIIGLDKRYALGLSTAETGKLEYSDEYQFLEEVRTYKIKLYGDGQAKEDNSFVYVDISGLQEATIKTESTATVKGTVSTKAATA